MDIQADTQTHSLIASLIADPPPPPRQAMT